LLDPSPCLLLLLPAALTSPPGRWPWLQPASPACGQSCRSSTRQHDGIRARTAVEYGCCCSGTTLAAGRTLGTHLRMILVQYTPGTRSVQDHRLQGLVLASEVLRQLGHLVPYCCCCADHGWLADCIVTLETMYVVIITCTRQYGSKYWAHERKIFCPSIYRVCPSSAPAEHTTWTILVRMSVRPKSMIRSSRCHVHELSSVS